MNRSCFRALLLTLVVLTAPACIPEGLAFVQDDRLEIVAPEDRAKVELPVTIDWTIEDFEVTGPTGATDPDAGYFAVFFDETPIPPGRTLEYLARDDARCRNTEGCPDRVYLADRGIYETSDTELTVKRLPDLDAFEGHELHEATVILLDGSGRRIGESAWFISFYYDRAVS